MAEVYGTRWTSAYGDNPDAGAGPTWAKGLAGVEPRQLAAGLSASIASADPWPPTLPEFVALCRQAPRPEPKKLPAPTIDEQTKAKRAEEMATGAFAMRPPGKWWARRILDSPSSYPAYSVAMAKQALDVPAE